MAESDESATGAVAAGSTLAGCASGAIVPPTPAAKILGWAGTDVAVLALARRRAIDDALRALG